MLLLIFTTLLVFIGIKQNQRSKLKPVKVRRPPYLSLLLALAMVALVGQTPGFAGSCGAGGDCACAKSVEKNESGQNTCSPDCETCKGKTGGFCALSEDVVAG